MKTLLTIIAITTNGFSNWAMAIGAAIIGFFAPIQLLFLAIIFATIVDLITAIIKSFQKSELSGFKKLKEIKSHKMRRTVLKMFAYIVVVAVIYLAEIAIFTTSIFASNAAAALILLVEIQSVCENMDIITKRNVFTRIFKKINSIFTKNVEDKISLK